MTKIIFTLLLGTALTSPSLFAMELEEETQRLAPTLENQKKYMVLSEDDRNSFEARADLLQKWESITFRDYTIEDLRSPMWACFKPEEKVKEDERNMQKQSRFIPGNGKKVMMSGDLVMAILDRPNRTFHKDGYTFQLTELKITRPLINYSILDLHAFEGHKAELWGDWGCAVSDMQGQYHLSYKIDKI